MSTFESSPPADIRELEQHKAALHAAALCATATVYKNGKIVSPQDAYDEMMKLNIKQSPINSVLVGIESQTTEPR
jgi:hypothetical protein